MVYSEAPPPSRNPVWLARSPTPSRPDIDWPVCQSIRHGYLAAGFKWRLSLHLLSPRHITTASVAATTPRLQEHPPCLPFLYVGQAVALRQAPLQGAPLAPVSIYIE